MNSFSVKVFRVESPKGYVFLTDDYEDYYDGHNWRGTREGLVEWLVENYGPNWELNGFSIQEWELSEKRVYGGFNNVDFAQN